MKKLIVLDFDGTIYSGDSMLHFAKFCSRSRYYFALAYLLLIYPLHFLRMVNRNQLKNSFLRINFKGIRSEDLKQKGLDFFELKKNNLFPKAKDFIEQNRQHELVIVSASCREWLLPFSQYLETTLICSQLDFSGNNNVCTGKLHGKNVSGVVKNECITNYYNLTDFDEILSFGNSKSDRSLAKISTMYFHKAFQNA